MSFAPIAEGGNSLLMVHDGFSGPLKALKFPQGFLYTRECTFCVL
jgi:hypothetical protein